MRAKQGAVAESQTAEVKRILGVSVLPIFVGGLVCTSGCAVIIKHAIDTGDEVYAQAVGLHGNQQSYKLLLFGHLVCLGSCLQQQWR